MSKDNASVSFYNSLIKSYKIYSQEEKKSEDMKLSRKMNSICKFFLSFSRFWEEKKTLRKELGMFYDGNFNIFTSIAEHYWYKNLHSDILKNILDPFTSVIGNSDFLKCFLELIDVNPNTFNYQNASVERESERIDLLIYDEKRAIIIENKINFACDQLNQLPRYYEKVTDPNGEYQKKVIKIVYITLTNKKNPSFEYSDEYKCYTSIIKELLIHVSAVNLPTNEFSSTWTLSNKNSFLDKLIEIAKDKKNENDICIVYLQQYKQLLNYLGEYEIMSDTNEKIVKLMFETEDSSEMTHDIVDIYNNKYEFLGNVCIKEIIDEDSNYEKIDDGIIGKKVSENVYAYFSVEAENSNKIYSYGFYNKNNDWTTKDNSTFEKKMKTSGIECNSQWVYKYLNYKSLENEKKLNKLTIEKMKMYIKGLIENISK